MLSPYTSYAAYMVFKLAEWSNGFESVKAVVSFFHEEADRHAQGRAQTVYIPYKTGQSGANKWMELEIGKFYVDG